MSAGLLGIEPRRRGEGPPIALLHGFLGSPADWEPVVEGWTDPRTAAFVTLPGHGPEVPPIPDGELSMESLARELGDRLREIDPSPWILIGYSLGGRLALAAAADGAVSVAGLGLVSSSPGIEDAAERRARADQDAMLSIRLRRQGFDRFLAGWYQQPVFASLRAKPDLVRRLVDERARRCDPEWMAAILMDLSPGVSPSRREALASSKWPLLVVAGEDDPRYVGIARSVAAERPDARVEVLSDAGHALLAEAPDRLAALLAGWVESL